MAYEPGGSAEEVHVTRPAEIVDAEPFDGHICVVPVGPTASKVTLPVGLDPPLTVAVQVSEEPATEGDAPLVRASEVDVAAGGTGDTVWATVPEDVPLAASP